MAIRGVNDLN